MNIKQFFDVINYKITYGEQYHRNTYGSNAYLYDYWNQDPDGYSTYLIFDTESQVVYESAVCDYKNNRAYRWINPDFVKVNDFENSNIAWDNVTYTDVSDSYDFLEKLEAIVDGVEYDQRVSITLDLPECMITDLMKLAHELDVTLNQLVEEILLEYLD